MMYIAKIKYYNEYANTSDHMEVVHCFVPADSRGEAVQMMEDCYGKDNIWSITIEDFSPDNFLEFRNNDIYLFNDVKEELGKNVSW